MRLALVLCMTIAGTASLVDFTNSVIYDIHDFIGVKEVHIAKCDSGCLIFAATLGEEFLEYPGGMDPYAANLQIRDNTGGKRYSIAELALQQDSNLRKIPLTINGKANISVVNLNNPADERFDTIALYVVEKAKAEEFSYEVYDAYYTTNKNKGEMITPQSDIVTFISAYDFRILADNEASTEPKSVTARLVGFDNALDNNKDGCPLAYKTSNGISFDGFALQASAGIVSLVVGKQSLLLRTDFQYDTVRDLGVDGFFATPGWNGCTKPNHGVLQSFRSTNEPDYYLFLSSNQKFYKVNLDVLPGFDSNHELTVTESKKSVVVSGTLPKQLSYAKTDNVRFIFRKMGGSQGFIVRYSSSSIPS